jgi:hypothetical protein
VSAEHQGAPDRICALAAGRQVRCNSGYRRDGLSITRRTDEPGASGGRGGGVPKTRSGASFPLRPMNNNLFVTSGPV